MRADRQLDLHLKTVPGELLLLRSFPIDRTTNVGRQVVPHGPGEAPVFHPEVDRGSFFLLQPWLASQPRDPRVLEEKKLVGHGLGTPAQIFPYQGKGMLTPSIVHLFLRKKAEEIEEEEYQSPISEERKKELWGSLIWLIRDAYRQTRVNNTFVKISAKIELEKNRAIIKGIPKAPETIIVEFIPANSWQGMSRYKPSILRVLSASGGLLGQTLVVNKQPWYKFSNKPLLRTFALEIWKEIRKILESSAKPEVVQTPKVVAPAAPKERYPGETLRMTIRPEVQKILAQHWDVQEGQSPSYGSPPSLYVVLPKDVNHPHGWGVRVKIFISDNNLRLYWGIHAMFSEREIASGDATPTPNIPALAKEIATPIIAEIQKFIREDSERIQRERDHATSRAGLIERIQSFLKGLRYGPAGRARNVDFSDGPHPSFEVDPQERQRLDHYGTSFEEDDDGEEVEQEGWDSDSWEEDYANPIISIVRPRLQEEFGDLGWSIDIDDKGFINIDVNNAKLPKR